MKIAIDARFFGTNTGIGRYLEQLILNLEKQDNENKYFILINYENENKYISKNKNFEKVIVNIPWYGIKEQIELPKILNKINPDLVHFPHFNVPFFYNKPFVVTIHDLILTKYPSRRATTLSLIKYFLKNILYRIIINRAVVKSKKIITVSQFTKKEIVDFFKINADKVIVTYEGVSDLKQINNINNEIIKNLGIESPFLLYVGNAYPHKNLEFLVKTFSEFSEDKSLKLVLVGREDYFYKRLKEFVNINNYKNIIFAGFVKDEDLAYLYKKCSVYVFPSLCEGFGLPPLEAMKCGAIVLSSNYSCLPEILKSSVIYFDPKDKKDLTNKLKIILNDENLKNELIEKSQMLLKEYSWEKMVFEVIDIYNSVK
ncbi:MAG: glycosyltransferase family 1 protein [Patescibacteria group bacterium]|nr:glycosyltransferase family 1 protein [Patescibacteria group bacterium]MDD4304440.1 glycosyltransferase family 1 protein [Patescibacteria group bacterium]MDD4695463.1 glycosyltransferase family 1 protein [Patescibacteria group bacterium]